ncbi:cuticle protein AMP1A-like [Penaeus monodon]|uniref:cuticle protein AMP1A-like n=1 Tax=Penaeus monodon TaxID=6687 RepID=UPI0018A725E0|nr:cuticle protein AMP1A-like [Penaeus monodon]
MVVNVGNARTCGLPGYGLRIEVSTHSSCHGTIPSVAYVNNHEDYRFACLVAVAVAAPQLQERVVELLRDERVANEDGTFSYALEADNGINTAVSGSIGAEGQINQEDLTPLSSRGGTQAIVSFVANENGFQPQSSILPTPHPLPAHVFELLEIAERQRAEGIVFEIGMELGNKIYGKEYKKFG